MFSPRGVLNNVILYPKMSPQLIWPPSPSPGSVSVWVDSQWPEAVGVSGQIKKKMLGGFDKVLLGFLQSRRHADENATCVQVNRSTALLRFTHCCDSYGTGACLLSGQLNLRMYSSAVLKGIVWGFCEMYICFSWWEFDKRIDSSLICLIWHSLA